MNIVHRKQLFFIITIGILGLALLVSTTWMHEQIQISAKRINVEKLLTQSIIYFILFFLFGILIEWKQALKALSGKIHLNKPLFIFSIALLAISLIPPIQWLTWYGFGSFKTPFSIFIKIMLSSDCHIAISILSGVLITKSITKELQETAK